GVEGRHEHYLPGLELAAELRVFARVELVAAEEIDGAMFRGGHQPGAGVVRNARLRPPLQSGDESVLRQLFGHTDIAHHTGEPGDEPGRLDPPYGVDHAMGIRGRHRGLSPPGAPWSGF